MKTRQIQSHPMVANLKRQKKNTEILKPLPFRMLAKQQNGWPGLLLEPKTWFNIVPTNSSSEWCSKDFMAGRKCVWKATLKIGERQEGGGGDTIFKTSGVNSRRIEFFRLIQFKRGWLGRPRSSQWDGIAGNFSKIRNRDFHQISFSSQNWGPELGYFDVWNFLLVII